MLFGGMGLFRPQHLIPHLRWPKDVEGTSFDNSFSLRLIVEFYERQNFTCCCTYVALVARYLSL